MAAAHPHSAAPNGHGNSGATKLDRLLAFHESAAAAIRMTIGLMNGHEKTTKTNGHASVLAEAIALDGARTAKTKTAKRPKTKKASRSKAAILAQRARTVKLLDAFDTKNPLAFSAVAADLGIKGNAMGLAPLVRHGYLKRKRGGLLIRTAKPYVVNPFVSG